MNHPIRDLTVFGATGFVGAILSRYLLEHYGTDGALRWAVAGRSGERLEQLRESLGPAAERLPTVVADASDAPSLRRLCEGSRVVLSTVGPYALHGEPLVRACAESGTDYCDLTGEVHWVRRMIDRYQTQAHASGARIVPCCGFDSIPSDLGVLFLQREAMRRFGAPCTRVKMRVKALRGGMSGGTAASLVNVIREAGTDATLRRELGDPYALCPPGLSRDVRQPSVSFARYDEDFGAWTAPFVMAAINTRVVHRSNALSDDAYGPRFRYDEAVLTGKGLRGGAAASALTVGLGGFVAAAALPPSRWLLERFVLPSPGEGPGLEAQRAGFFDLRFLGRTADGRTLRVKVTGDRDPGYGATGKMLGEAGACMALDVGRDEFAGGFWTPATLFGQRLIDRLVASAGLRFEVLEA